MDGSWEAIERIGRELGATEEAIRKWRTRGVPRFWRHDLIKADWRREIDDQAFDNPPGSRRAAETTNLGASPEQAAD